MDCFAINPFIKAGGLVVFTCTVREIELVGGGGSPAAATNEFLPLPTVTGAGRLAVQVMIGLGPALVEIVQVNVPAPIGRVFTNAFAASRFHPFTPPQFVVVELLI